MERLPIAWRTAATRQPKQAGNEELATNLKSRNAPPAKTWFASYPAEQASAKTSHPAGCKTFFNRLGLIAIKQNKNRFAISVNGLVAIMPVMRRTQVTAMDYKTAGVDVEKGDAASKAFYEASRRTWKNRVQSGFDDFSGVRYCTPPSGVVMGENVDGIGTKSEVAERLQRFETLGFDLLAMVCDDAVVRGGEPFYVTNVLDVSKVEEKPMAFLAAGLEAAAKEAGVAVVNGEIAELGAKVGGYGAFRLNWAASCTWFAKKERLISGKEVKEGDSIITFKEEGFRSNGLSLARKIMEREHGDEWHESDPKLVEQILRPSKIYSRFAVSLFGGIAGQPIAKVPAMAHITGGGIPGKLGRALKPSGLGASLEDIFEPCKAMKRLMEIGNVDVSEAYRAWNMGNGFMVITPEPDAVMAQAKKFKLQAKVAGNVLNEKSITIEGKRAQTDGKPLVF